jgi:hypothetical protein
LVRLPREMPFAVGFAHKVGSAGVASLQDKLVSKSWSNRLHFIMTGAKRDVSTLHRKAARECGS